MTSATAVRTRPPTREPSPAPDLTREVALLAGRLAALLERLPAAGAETVAQGREFLRSAFRPGEDEPVVESLGRSARERLVRSSSPMARIVTGFGLSSLEVDLILLAGMAEEHEGYASILRVLHPRGEPRPTVGLAAQLFCADEEERLALRMTVEGRGGGPIALVVQPEGPFFERSLSLPERLWSALLGVDVWPDGLDAGIESPVQAGLETWLETPTARLAREALRRRDRCTVLFEHDSSNVAMHRAVALAANAGVPAIVLRPTSVGVDTERLIAAHAVARGVVPILVLPIAEAPLSSRAFAMHPGCLVVCAGAGASLLGGARPLLAVPVEPLEPIDRRRMWEATLPELRRSAPELATRHALEPFAAAESASDARRIGELMGRKPSTADVLSSVRTRAGLSITGGVKLIRPTATWDALVLPADRERQLRDAVDRLVHQSKVLDEWGFLRGRPGARGVRMLFSGPPGTGKTLSAEVLARELGVDLLVVDISRVVSKWIGETEKNLAEVFNTAERAEAVLFFDEADALFGKRTEVSDAHDRYANLETAYLLTRLERFDGLAILSTNLRQNIDQAFVRRLEFVVDFEEPGREERLALWRCHVPPDAPLGDDADFAELADLYPVVGGVIRNAAVAAAFLAAADGQQLTRRHFVRAIWREYAKTGRSFPGEPADATPEQG